MDARVGWRRKATSWTDAMDNELRRAHGTEELSTSIARRLGVHVDTLRKRQKILKLGYRTHMMALGGQAGIEAIRAHQARIKLEGGNAGRFSENYTQSHAKHVESVLAADPRGFPTATPNGWVWTLGAWR